MFRPLLIALLLSTASCATQHKKASAPINIPKPQIANIREQSADNIKKLDDTLNRLESRAEKIKLLLNSIE
jgi:hypothetical protein